MKKALYIICLVAAVALLYMSTQNVVPKGEIKNNEIVGTYTIPGYCPNSEDIAAVPYSYYGESENYTVKCNVREATPAEFQSLINSEVTWLNDSSMFQEYPMAVANDMRAAIQGEIDALLEAGTLYLTEIYGTSLATSEVADETEDLEISIMADAEIFMKFKAPNIDGPWAYTQNTADGGFSKGILLPKKTEYKVIIQCGEKQETINLRLVSEEKIS